MFKNNRTLSKNTLININSILKFIFLNHNISNLVQIGANDGRSFDELNSYIKKYKPKSILVEPIKESFLQLKENYKNVNNVSAVMPSISYESGNLSIS